MSSNSENLEVRRQLVLSFEHDYKEKIDLLLNIEKNIIELNKQRKNYLTNLLSIDNNELILFNKQIKSIQLNGELISNRLMSDIMRLQGKYEEQTLNYLLESTKPFDDPMKSIDIHMNDITQKHIKQLKDGLIESLNERKKFLHFVNESNQQIDTLVNNYITNNQITITNLKNKLVDLNEKLAIQLSQSNDVYKSILSDYLIYRHNSLIAKEILLTNKNNIMNVRNELNTNNQMSKLEKEKDIQYLCQTYQLESQLVINNKRQVVIQKERLLDEITKSVNSYIHSTKSKVKKLKDQIVHYDNKYQSLNEKRYDEITVMNNEITKLRKKIIGIENTIKYSKLTNSPNTVTAIEK